MLNVGIVGMGVIGHRVAEALTRGIPGTALVGVSVRNTATAGAYPVRPLPELIERADLIVEAATQASLREFGPAVLAAGKHLMVLSVGALVGVLDEWARLAEKHACRILVPSGAIAGLDGVKGAREGAITAVTMETRKPPRGLAGAPYLVQHGIEVSGITAPKRVFEGNAFDAAAGFPANVNVAAALALAGIGPARTRVEIWADPGIDRNTHTIRVEADSARFTMTIENVPSEENPRTGQITALSMLACLRGLVATLKVGT